MIQRIKNVYNKIDLANLIIFSSSFILSKNRGYQSWTILEITYFLYGGNEITYFLYGGNEARGKLRYLLNPRFLTSSPFFTFTVVMGSTIGL